MTDHPLAIFVRNETEPFRNLRTALRHSVSVMTVIFALALATTGCKTAPVPASAAQAGEAGGAEKPGTAPEVLVLREGDAVRITFPGAPNLNTVQAIRRDGKLALPLVGEVQAAGLTCPQLEKELIKVYGPQLQTKEVTVTLESSAFSVYVTGSVLRPGKVVSDRPLTALEAIMEAGGCDYNKANLKAVTVLRQENGQQNHYKLNLKGMIKGEPVEPLKLKPSDIVYVPEKFTWF